MVHRGALRCRVLRALGLLALAAGHFAAWPAAARADDVFAVTGVPVDVTADSATAAREQALLEGQRKAVQILFKRLTLPEDASKLPQLNDAELFEVVQGIEVEREKISSVRYLGDLTVRFKPDAIRSLLRTAGIRYAETASKPLVVVPVYRTSDATLLWDETNPWLAAWSAHVGKGGLVPFIVPLGDLTDMGAIGADDAVQGTIAKLDALAHRYHASDTLVAIAMLSTAPAGVDITETHYASGQLQRTDVLHVAAEAGEAPDALLARAVGDVQNQIEQNWKQENLLRFDREDMLTATVPLHDLAEWISVRRKLADSVLIRSVEIVSFSKSQAIVGLHYLGDAGQLKLALSQKDLDLTQDGVNWTLRLTAPPPEAVPTPGAVPPAQPAGSPATDTGSTAVAPAAPTTSGPVATAPAQSPPAATPPPNPAASTAVAPGSAAPPAPTPPGANP